MQISLAEYFALLRRYLAPQRGLVAGLAVLLLGSMALQLAGPQAIRAFIDSATVGAGQSELARLALLFREDWRVGAALTAFAVEMRRLWEGGGRSTLLDRAEYFQGRALGRGDAGCGGDLHAGVRAVGAQGA